MQVVKRRAIHGQEFRSRTYRSLSLIHISDNEGEEEDGLKLPPLEILHANPQSASAASSDKELEQTAESLQSTLLEFGRSARVVGWIAGPTVTTFKLQPGEGERVSKISSLEDDLSLIHIYSQ